LNPAIAGVLYMELEFVLENTTPLFIAGADQQDIVQEGLRPPSVKGMIRHWFRNLLGGVTFELGRFDYLHLLASENRLLGSTVMASPVRIIGFPLETQVMNWGPGHSFGAQIDYLYYSMKGGGPRPGRSFYQPGSRFRLEIIIPPGIERRLNPLVPQAVIGALWAGFYLAGSGSRIRRGAGNLRVIEAPAPDRCGGISFKHAAATREEYVAFLQTNLRSIRNTYHKLAEWLTLPPPSNKFSVPPMQLLAPGYTSIFIGPEETGWQPALEFNSKLLAGDLTDTMAEMASLRSAVKDKNFIHTLASVLKGEGNVRDLQKSLWNEMRPLLGMPLNFFFKTIKKRATLGDRYPSPLWIGVAGSDPFMPKVLLFKTVMPQAQQSDSLSLSLNLGREFGRPINIRLPGKEKQMEVLETLRLKLAAQMTEIPIEKGQA
jgi:hypothetical protein